MDARVAILGCGAFAHAIGQLLKEAGATVAIYCDSPHGHHGASLAGTLVTPENGPDIASWLRRWQPQLVIPATLAGLELALAEQHTVVGPNRHALALERDRQFASELCRQHGVRVPRSHHARNALEARLWLRGHPGAYVIKNPLCTAGSPIQAVVCQSQAETLAWLKRLDDSEGVFLQENLGSAEAGHFAAVSGGQITSLITNQEYKRAHSGNLGPLASTPLGGIVERDPGDRYGLARALIHPLKPWLEDVGFSGIIQASGIRRRGQWHAIEYNVRLGMTSGALLLQMLSNPLECLHAIAADRPVTPRWLPDQRFGASLSLAGHGYPHAIPDLPSLPVSLSAPIDCRLWWHHTRHDGGGLHTEPGASPLRIADLNATGPELGPVIDRLYRNIERIHCHGSHYRLDLGDVLWPPGSEQASPRSLMSSAAPTPPTTVAHAGGTGW